MRKLLAILFLVSFIIHNSFSQSTADSLIKTLNIEIIQGKVSTYYTPGNNKAATDLQKTITYAINYYERIQPNKFKFRSRLLFLYSPLNSIKKERKISFLFYFYSNS